VKQATSGPASAGTACGSGRGSKPIGTGGRRQRDVDEDLLVRRYTKARWTVAECARAAKISGDRARAILLAHNVTLREKPLLDEAAIVAAYQRQRSIHQVAVGFGTYGEKIKAILDAHGIETHWCRPELSLQACGLAPSSRITTAEAARLLGKPRRFIEQAADAGQIRAERDERGHPRFIRGDIEAFADRLRITTVRLDHARRARASADKDGRRNP
jgi:excisionase family DNA binding protein